MAKYRARQAIGGLSHADVAFSLKPVGQVLTVLLTSRLKDLVRAPCDPIGRSTHALVTVVESNYTINAAEWRSSDFSSPSSFDVKKSVLVSHPHFSMAWHAVPVPDRIMVLRRETRRDGASRSR
jgi:hypothetical protein